MTYNGNRHFDLQYILPQTILSQKKKKKDKKELWLSDSPRQGPLYVLN